MVVVRQNGSPNISTGVVAAVTSDLNASSHRDSRPKEDLDCDNTVLDQLLHHPVRKQNGGVSGMMGNSSINLSSSALWSLSQVDLTPHTEWESTRKKNKGHASTNNETLAEAGDGKDRPSEKKAARVASLWKAVKKEVMGSSVYQTESELRAENKNNLASISTPADLNNAKFFPKEGGDAESADRSSEKKAHTHALWNIVKKEVMGSRVHQAEPVLRKKNKTNSTSRASESILSTIQARPKEGDENTERPSEKKARATPLSKIVKKDIMGSSVHHESESRRKYEAVQAAEVSTEKNAATAESGSNKNEDGEQEAGRPLEKKALASALWNKVMKKEAMDSGVKKQGIDETWNNNSRGGLSSSYQSLMKKARKQSSARDLTQPEENRINTDGLEETKKQLRGDKKLAITKWKRVNPRLLLKKALSQPSIMNQWNTLPVEKEARDFADGNIIESNNIASKSKSYERLQSQAKEVECNFSGDDGEETVGKKYLVRRRSTSRSRSNSRRGRRSHPPDPSLTEQYDQPRDADDKHRSFGEEDSMEEAIAYSSRDPAKRSEKQQRKREERSPRRGRRSQLRKLYSDPALADSSTSWPEGQYDARDVSKLHSKQLRKQGEVRRARTPISGRRSQFRRAASEPSLKEVTAMEKLEILFSGHNSLTSTQTFSQDLAPANEVKKNEPPMFASFKSAKKTAEEQRRKLSFDDTSLDEDSTICSNMSSEMLDLIDEEPSANRGRIDDLATDAAAVFRRDDFSQDDFSVDEAATVKEV
jgi:hypothetical protein